MKKLFALLLLVQMVLLIEAQTAKNFIDQPYIEVTGKAKMEIVPDEIFISIELKEDDSKGKQAVESLEKKMIKTLVDIGIDVANDLTISDYSSRFKDYWYKKKDIHNTKSYMLKVNSGVKVAEVFMAMEDLGISNMEVVKTDHSQIEAYKEEVKVKSIQAAQKKASNLAKAIDQNIGKAIYIQERNYLPYRTKVNNVAFEASTSLAKMDLPTIDFEKIVLEYEIFVRFTLDQSCPKQF